MLDSGLFEKSEEGTPQGGPLSPLLSNLVLDELDRELERRGHRFVRYADDCNIYVRSEKAGRRVMQSLTHFIERRLKLQVNAAKSAVDRPWRRSFLSFTLRDEPELRRCIAVKAVIRFKHRVRELTGRHRGVSLERMIRELAHIFVDGPATSASASGVSCHRSKAGSDDACVASPGSSGRRAAGATANCAALRSPNGWRAKPSSAQRVLGGSASARLCIAPSPKRAFVVWVCRS